MGGLRNQFSFADAGPPFLRQHDLLVAYGDGGAVREYDADGSVVWEIEGDPGYVSRPSAYARSITPAKDRWVSHGRPDPS